MSKRVNNRRARAVNRALRRDGGQHTKVRNGRTLQADNSVVRGRQKIERFLWPAIQEALIAAHHDQQRIAAKRRARAARARA